MFLSYSRRAAAALLTAALCIPGAGALNNISPWATESVAAAEAAGIVPSTLLQSNAQEPITRAEFCGIALNTYKAVSGKAVFVSGKKPFRDCDDPNVTAAYQLGIVNGRGNGIFDPDDTIQRQDLCVMLYNILDAADLSASEIAGDAAVEDYADMNEVNNYAVHAVVTMVDHAIVNGVSSASQPAKLLPAGTATREQALIMANRFCAEFQNDSRPSSSGNSAVLPTEDEPADNWTAKDFTLPQTEEEKMALVYGEGGTKYQSSDEAEANMIEITVPVWRLQSDGSKTTGTAYLQVNKNLASLYEAIFEEIYNGPERFPIKNVGCYSWRTGEHSQGTAVDINWEENMEATINADGSLTPTCGTHWTPGEDPYSIPENGDVYNAFTKYGFAWGGNAWRSKRDYMHFSYFGR